MIDLHAHILPRIDDGPADLAEALEMCRMAVQDGTTVIVATPHLFRAGRGGHAGAWPSSLPAALSSASICPRRRPSTWERSRSSQNPGSLIWRLIWSSSLCAEAESKKPPERLGPCGGDSMAAKQFVVHP